MLSVLCLLGLAVMSSPAWADNEEEEGESRKALYEVGLGAAGAVYPDFRGSDHYNVIGAPIPVVIYRGDFLQVSGDDASARLVDQPRFEINVTAGGAPPVNSDADNGREGMPDLDATFSIGPSFDVLLSDPDDDDNRLCFRVPVRAAFALDFEDFRNVGTAVRPHLVYNRSWDRADTHWVVSARVGAIWASDDFHDYYYSVDPEFATAQRPAFDAAGGYSGFSAGGLG